MSSDDLLVDDGPLAHSPSFLALMHDAIPEEEVKEERGKSLGVKSIGTWLSFIFVINQIYGPGVLAIPLVYAQAGLMPTMFMVTFFLLCSSLASTCLAQAIASIPDNRQYQQRVEFATAVEYYYGHKWHVAFQICLNITVQAYNIASIVICAQSIDQAFITMTGHTYAFEFGPDFGFHHYANTDLLYNSTHVAITVGYLVITLFFLPAGFLNLNDNVKTVQVGSFVFLIVLMLELVGFFMWKGNQEGYHSVPVFGTNYAQLVSVFIFSWAYVIFVPSWLCEKSVDVSVNKVIWSAGIVSWVGYIAVGWLCASVFTGSDIGLDNMLASLSKPGVPTITRLTSHLFSLGVIAPGIPVCSVTTRYNLFVGGIVGKKQSYFWGCIAPWIVGFIFCQGTIFGNLIAWTSLLFNGLVNFLVPFVMYLTSLKRQQLGGAPKDPSVTGINAPHAPLDEEEEAEVEEEEAADARKKAALASAYTASTTVMQVKTDLRAPLLDSESDSSAVVEPLSPQLSPTNGYLLQPAAPHSDRGGEPVHFCSPIQDANFQHGPVFPYPESLRAYAYPLTLAMLIVTQAIITIQTVADIYYAAIGKNVLSS